MFGPIHPRTAPSSPPAGTRGKVAGRCRWWGSGPIRRSSLAISPDGFQSNQGPAFPGHGVSCVSFPGYSSQELQLLTLPGNKLVSTILPGVAFTKPLRDDALDSSSQGQLGGRCHLRRQEPHHGIRLG